MIFTWFNELLKQILLIIINIYQKTLSPDEGWLKGFYPYGFCRFEPHCSEYCRQAISKYGPYKGTYLCSYRLLRCHPWSKGGHDPVK